MRYGQLIATSLLCLSGTLVLGAGVYMLCTSGIPFEAKLLVTGVAGMVIACAIGIATA